MLFRKDKKAPADQSGALEESNSNTTHVDDEVAVAASSDAAAEANEKPQQLVPVKSTASQVEYPSGVKLALILISVFVSMFLVALDRLIIATAIPQITDDFHSLPDVGWYGSAYLLTSASFQLAFGKLYSFFPIKVTFLATVLLFEVGSAICGAAPTSTAFIIGRAVAGIGSAGIFSGAITIIVYAVPLHKRPLYQGLFGAVFGLASVVGPLVGGAFTSNVSWRWCFYINLPIGGVAMVVIFFLLQIPERDIASMTLKQKLAQLDAVGTGVLIPGVVCLLLALQWGGLTYPWSDARIIALLTLGGVLLLAFVVVQVLMPKTATVPPRIFVQRSILAGFWATLCVGSQMMIFVYYLPIWFQAIKGVSAVDSGIRLIPLTLGMVVASMATGIVVSKIGYYTPPMLIGTCILCVGAGLLTTLQIDTEQPKWVGYQVLYGLGMGMTFQAPNLAAQTVLPTRDVPIGTSLMFFSQMLGGAVFISVGENVLNNQLLTRLSGLPGFSPSMISAEGATSLTSSLPANLLGPVLDAYNESLRVVFRVGLILTCLTIFGSAAMEWRSVKEKQQAKAKAQADAENAGAAASTSETVAAEEETEAEIARVQSKASQAEVAAAGQPIPTAPIIADKEEKV